VADRPHAALEPGDVHGALHADPGPLLEPPRIADAWLRTRPVLLQREGRAVRGVPGRRAREDRDALPARRLRALRRLPGAPVQPGDARRPLQGRNIADVLDMTVAEALEFFDAVPRIKAKLQTLDDVGLGYIHVGQAATTLSGGEAQRVKLATELSRRATGSTIYILDEPTTGLHFEDVRVLLDVLHRLVGMGNTVVVIEHNLHVVKTADWIIALGAEGGAAGGRIVVEGTPEDVARCEASHTGRYLRPLLRGAI